MSLKLNEKYPGRFANPSAGYPLGAFKNRTTPTAKDGSYLEKDWANDKEGFFQSLIAAAGITPNGLVDQVGASQFYDALLTVLGQQLATTTKNGVVKLATSAQMATGTDTSLVPPVAAVMSLFSKRVFATNDYIRIPDVPGGFIIQWGGVVGTNGGLVTATFPINFNNTLHVIPFYQFGGDPGTLTQNGGGGVIASTTSTATFRLLTGFTAVKYLAIGN